MAFDTAIAIGMQLFVFTMFYAAFHTNRKHGPMQILFIFMGFFMQIINLDLMRQIAVAAAQAAIAETVSYAYNASIYIVTVVLMYFVIMFLWELLTRFRSPEGL